MNKTKIALGIGIVIAVLAVFTASAAANTAYFVPQHGNATTGNYTYVHLYLDLDAGQHIAGGQLQIQFDPVHANITGMSKGCGAPEAGKYCWGALDKNFWFTKNGYMWGGIHAPQEAVWDDEDEIWVWEDIWYFEGPMTIKICKYKVEAVGTPGESPFNFGFEMFPEGCNLCQPCMFSTELGDAVGNMTWINGTFTHIGGALMSDLVITDKYETLADDGTFTVTYIVTNIGDGDAGASTTSIITSDGPSATDSVPALAAGQSYTSTVAGFNCSCGITVTVTVCADNGDVIDESDETNNCLENELTCQPCGQPDLEITDIWTEVKVGKKFNTTRIYYNITNNGDANAGRSVSNLTVDGVPTSKKDGVKPLEVGDTRTESFRYSKRLGTPTTIKVCADCGKKSITESNETNNCMEKTVTCT